MKSIGGMGTWCVRRDDAMDMLVNVVADDRCYEVYLISFDLRYLFECAFGNRCHDGGNDILEGYLRGSFDVDVKLCRKLLPDSSSHAEIPKYRHTPKQSCLYSAKFSHDRVTHQT